MEVVLTRGGCGQVRCELAVIAQHRHRVRQHIKSRPLVRAMLQLEARLVEYEVQSRGGADQLAQGHRIFLCTEDWPKLNGIAAKRGVHEAAAGVSLRCGDFVEADGNQWLHAVESEHIILVPVHAAGRRGAVPAHVLRWLRQPGEQDDEPPLREVDPLFAGIQYSVRQKKAALRLQTWGKCVIAKQQVQRRRDARKARERVAARRERLVRELEREQELEARAEGVRSAAALPLETAAAAGANFGGASASAVEDTYIVEEDVKDELDDDDDDDDEAQEGKASNKYQAKRGKRAADGKLVPGARGLGEKSAIFVQKLQLGLRLRGVRFLVTRWYGREALTDMASPADAACFEDVISTMAYWHNMSKCPASQRQRRRTIDQAVRSVKAVLLVAAYVAGWKCRRLKAEKQARLLRDAENRALREQQLARQRQEEEERRRKVQAQEALDAHVSAAVKDLREEAARLRQTARSISTENELLHFSLHQKEGKVEQLQARVKEQDAKLDKLQAEVLQASLAARRQQEEARFEDLRRAASGASSRAALPNQLDHSQPLPGSIQGEPPLSPIPDRFDVSPVHSPSRAQAASKATFTSTQATAAIASASPWAHEKRISRDIQHHKQVRARVRACGAACLLARAMHVRSATRALRNGCARQSRRCLSRKTPESTHAHRQMIHNLEMQRALAQHQQAAALDGLAPSSCSLSLSFSRLHHAPCVLGARLKAAPQLHRHPWQQPSAVRKR